MGIVFIYHRMTGESLSNSNMEGHERSNQDYAFGNEPGLTKFDWKVVAQWATKNSNLVAQQ